MVRVLVLIALAGCSSPKPAPKEPFAWMDEAGCLTFDPSNPNCEFLCPRTAPQGWPGCEDAADDLIARGYICQSRMPHTCQPPPHSIKAPIISLETTDGTGEITIGVGMSKGVSLDWTAILIDAQHHPIDSSFITLEVVNDNDTRGSVFVMPQRIPTVVGVLLLP
jgi:hypothetical protein